MKAFERWLKDEYGIEMPHGTVNSSWFFENGLPMIVECTCCGSTMVLPSAMIDDEGLTYCRSCAGEED